MEKLDKPSVPIEDATIEFEGESFSDADLRALPNLEHVQSLGLWKTSVTDMGCRELTRARSLVEISIISESLTDDALKTLSQLPALRSLQIHRGPRIGDNGLAYLSSCHGLRELYLKETAITDRGLAAVCRLPEVWSLILDDTNVSDDGCSKLAEMPRLGLLSLRRTQVAGHSLALLRDNEHFNIYLDETPVTDESVIAFAQHLSNLKLISLSKTNIGDLAAKALAKIPRLNVVRLSNTKITDEGLAAFSDHPHLDAIDVQGCSISANAVQSLKSSKRRLMVYGS